MIFNIGSINIDHVYNVSHFVAAGETLQSYNYKKVAGGKGFNQSVALARAGAAVTHAGCVGSDGAWLVESLAKEGCQVSIGIDDTAPTGHAIIQVEESGQNSILLCAGANHCITELMIDQVLAQVSRDDLVLLQNETSSVRYVIEQCARKHIPVAVNVAPATPADALLPLESVRYLFVNEIEAAALSGQLDPGAALKQLQQKAPHSCVVLTLGSAGSIASYEGELYHCPSCEVSVVDTTAAGDTYTGYFLAAQMSGASIPQSMKWATKAASLCVGRAGASISVPCAHEISADHNAAKACAEG